MEHSEYCSQRITTGIGNHSRCQCDCHNEPFEVTRENTEPEPLPPLKRLEVIRMVIWSRTVSIWNAPDDYYARIQVNKIQSDLAEMREIIRELEGK